MVRRIARMLVALAVALGLVAMPAALRAMPMSGDMTGAVLGQPCEHCPQSQQTGSTAPDKMAVCQIVGCAAAAAVLPSPVLLPGRVLLEMVYSSPAAAHLAGAEPAPDPLPPRPAVLL